MVASIQQFPIMQLVTALESLHVRVFSVEIKFLLLRPSGADRVSKNNDNWDNILGSGVVYLVGHVEKNWFGVTCPFVLPSASFFSVKKLPLDSHRAEMMSLVTY